MLVWFNSPQTISSRFLLLDRDGILNENRPDYVKSLDEVKFYPDALEALRLLARSGIGVILISNQSGINRGIITWNDFWRMHEGIISQVERSGGSILAAYYCPHRPDEKCGCRKPSPAMIQAACRLAGIKPRQTSFIGDNESDMEAAANAGCRGIRVCRGEDPGITDTCTAGQPAFASLLDAVLDLYPL
ncbi:MAG: D-glycero-alpha-D-manno-heptose-1,7-bisphosphate 7-phosphatase [Syntrophobacteraceae bacterium]